MHSHRASIRHLHRLPGSAHHARHACAARTALRVRAGAAVHTPRHAADAQARSRLRSRISLHTVCASFTRDGFPSATAQHMATRTRVPCVNPDIERPARNTLRWCTQTSSLGRQPCAPHRLFCVTRRGMNAALRRRTSATWTRRTVLHPGQMNDLPNGTHSASQTRTRVRCHIETVLTQDVTS